MLFYSIIRSAVLLTTIFVSSLFCENEVDNINYYSDGIDKISLYNIPQNVGYKLKISGNSKYNTLLFQISKVGAQGKIEKSREVKLDLDDNNNFDYYYYLKDGIGEYIIRVYGNNLSGQGNYKGLCYFVINATNSLPENLPELNINKKIVKLLDSLIGKRIGRGECWDLAQYLLDYYNADWKRLTDFGKELDYKSDKISAGDIIQMYNVKLAYNNKVKYFGLPQHTAVVYKVISKNHFKIAHQNVEGKRYVIISDFDLSHLKTGKIYFYRPVAGLIKNINRENQYEKNNY